MSVKSSRALRATIATATLMAAASVMALQRNLPEGTAAEAPHVSQLIIKFKSQEGARNAAAALEQVAAQHGVQLTGKHLLAQGARVFKLNQDMTQDQAAGLARELARLPGVVYAEPDRIAHPQSVAGVDPEYVKQWHYFEPIGGIGLPDAWKQADGAGVTVAVLDTGYRPHVDLVGNIVAGYDFVSDADRARDGNGRDADAQDQGDWTKRFGFIPINSSWHGTHVAGTIAAVTGNGIGVAGVAPKAHVMPVRVLAKDGGTESDIADAIIWASGGKVAGVPATKTPARVINMSLGGTGSCSTTIQSAINEAFRRGTVVVVSAGNSSTNASKMFPASCKRVLTVAATDRSGGRASYSNYGKTVELAAPGGGGNDPVWSTLNSGSHEPRNDIYGSPGYMGTSMAAPHVSGVVALVLSKNPKLSPRQVTRVLLTTARPFPAACKECGRGLLDAAAAVAATPAP